MVVFRSHGPGISRRDPASPQRPEAPNFRSKRATENAPWARNTGSEMAYRRHALHSLPFVSDPGASAPARLQQQLLALLRAALAGRFRQRLGRRRSGGLAG